MYDSKLQLVKNLKPEKYSKESFTVDEESVKDTFNSYQKQKQKNNT